MLLPLANGRLVTQARKERLSLVGRQIYSSRQTDKAPRASHAIYDMHVSFVQYNIVSAYAKSDLRSKQNLETSEPILADIILP